MFAVVLSLFPLTVVSEDGASSLDFETAGESEASEGSALPRTGDGTTSGESPSVGQFRWPDISPIDEELECTETGLEISKRDLYPEDYRPIEATGDASLWEIEHISGEVFHDDTLEEKKWIRQDPTPSYCIGGISFSQECARPFGDAGVDVEEGPHGDCRYSKRIIVSAKVNSSCGIKHIKAFDKNHPILGWIQLQQWNYRSHCPGEKEIYSMLEIGGLCGALPGIRYAKRRNIELELVAVGCEGDEDTWAKTTIKIDKLEGRLRATGSLF